MINVKLSRNVINKTENTRNSDTHECVDRESTNIDKSSNISEEKIMKVIYVVAVFIAIAAKLENYIDWSWWWVFTPLWLGAMIELVYLIILKRFITNFMKD